MEWHTERASLVDGRPVSYEDLVKEVLDLEPLCAKQNTLRWAVLEIDGHNLDQIERSFTIIPIESGKPTCVIANTVKGKDVSFMEDKLLWHYRGPDRCEMARTLAELGDLH
jgi:transketolase